MKQLDDFAAKGVMHTHSGQYVNLLNPATHMLHLEDVIFGTQRILRFNGHSDLSLANHLCRTYRIAVEHFGCDDERTLRAVLMHDAHEVWVGDVSAPLKHAMRCIAEGFDEQSDYDMIEERIEGVTAKRFGFDFPHPPIVKKADMLALGIEADMTFGEGTAQKWGLPKPLPQFRNRRDDFEWCAAELGIV